MANIRYTHSYHLLHQFIIHWGVGVVGTFLLTAIVVLTLQPAWKFISADLSDDLRNPIQWIACIAIWCGCFYLLLKAIITPLDPLPTWLYLRFTLLVPATWQDAKDTEFLFEGDISGKWYPLTELKRVPKQFRREVLHEFADQVRFRVPNFTWRRQQSTPTPQIGVEDAPIPQQPDSRMSQARALLGVTSRAGQEEIKTAYRQLIKKYHPDVYAGSQPELQHFAHSKTSELNEAYDLLVNTNNGTTDYM